MRLHIQTGHRQPRTLALTWVSTAAVLTACSAPGPSTTCTDACSSVGTSSGGSSSGSSGGSGSSSGTSSGSSDGAVGSGVDLQVHSATTAWAINHAAPSAGTFFALVDFTLQNVGAPTPVSTSAAFLSLDTTHALVVSAATDQPHGSCNTGVSLAAGGQIECQVAFQVPSGATPSMLIYDDRQGDRASAPILWVPPPSNACPTVQGWVVNSASSTCTSCLGSIQAGDCWSARSAYDAQCTCWMGTCNPGSPDLCACERACDPGPCQALFDNVMACLEATCAGSCP
jgi:hypothetical protein